MDIKPSKIDTIKLLHPSNNNFEIDMLRLDETHPKISGNKGYKLMLNIKQAIAESKKSIVTIGGAFSNHLHATAYLCKLLQLQSIGIVRGDVVVNDTLNDCVQWGMQLHFHKRELFKKENEKALHNLIKEKYPDSFFVPMGGDNELGIEGAMHIYNNHFLEKYTHIICSVGTGTTLLGLIKASNEKQKLIGICAVKDHNLDYHFEKNTNKTNFAIFQNYRINGFGKINDQQIEYILDFYKKNNILLDIVYTSKMMLAIEDLVSNNYFNKDAKILCIHTGGLQGNRSVDTLKYLTKQ